MKFVIEVVISIYAEVIADAAAVGGDGLVVGDAVEVEEFLHTAEVVVGRNDVEEILDDAKAEIDAEGISRQCNPTARHAVGEHRTDGFWNGILLLIV